MPFGVAQVAQSSRLRCKLLHAVLAEDGQAGSVCFAHAFYGNRLAHAHQHDFVWIAGCPARRCCDSLPHLRDIFRNRHKAKTTKDTKYHEGESRVQEASSAPLRTNASVATQPWSGEGTRLSTNFSLHHADRRGGFAGIAGA